MREVLGIVTGPDALQLGGLARVGYFRIASHPPETRSRP
jgi:hypothetical protein